MPESDAQEIGRSGILLLLGTAFSMASGFIFKIILSNHLDGGSFGLVMLATSTIGIISIPTVMGLNQGVVKFISSAKNRGEKADYIYSSILIVLILSLGTSLLMLIFSEQIHSTLFSQEGASLFFLFFAITIPIVSVNKVIKGSLQGLMETKQYTALSQILQPILRIVIGGGIAIIIGSAYSVMAGIFLAYLITILTGTFILYRLGLKIKKPEINPFPLVRFSLPLIISSSVYIILTRVDRVFIGYFMTPFSVGQYEVAMTIAMLLALFHSAFSFLLFPKISEMDANSSQSEIPAMYAQTTKWILVCTTPAFLVLLLRPDLLISLFGDQYSVSNLQPVLAVISVGLFLDAVVGPNGQALLGFGKSKSVMYYNIIAVTINIFLNIVFIPEYGLIGAALASLVGYSVMNGLKSADLYINHNISVMNLSGMKMMAGASLFAMPLLIATNPFPIIIEVPFLACVGILSIATGFVTIALTGDLTKSDREIISMVTSRLFSYRR